MTKKKDGRNKPNKNPLKDIDEKKVFELASRFWNKTEIAAFLGCSDKTISNRFSEIYTKGKESGKGKLRDWQLSSAKTETSQCKYGSVSSILDNVILN
jgi:hypothetical protein